MRLKSIWIVLLCSLSLSAQSFEADSVLFDAYLREDMSVWKNYLDKNAQQANPDTKLLVYEYGYCGYVVDCDKAHALPYVQRFRQHIEALKNRLPKGHYEMFLSAVYVFELQLHESIHPIKATTLAKEAVQLAGNDPIVLSYYGTCLFYAPRPFGSKQEALEWFTKAEQHFREPKWKYCWLREANSMYIHQCRQKLNK